MQLNNGYLHTEQELLLRISKGEEAAFTVIYNRYKDAVYYTASKMTGSYIIAEEVVQDLFLKFWIKREKAIDIVSVKAYLHTMAENLVFDAVKKQEREQKYRVDGEEQTVSATPAVLLEHKDYEIILKKAINRLPLKQRETYKLIKERGLKRNEAAAELNVSPETIKWNLDQAMRSIRANCLLQLGMNSGIVLLIVNNQ
jgi:RNA polymerase sigma-70 factor (ECF subfamily)